MISGFLAGIFGLGGGIFVVPTLSVMGFSLVEAAATSLVGVLTSAISGSWQNWQMGKLNVRASLQIALAGIPMALVGAILGDYLPEFWLTQSFAVLLLLTIYGMHRQQTSQKELDSLEFSPLSKSNPLPLNWSRSLPIGSIAGLLSGLFGIGGGVVMVPLQVIFLAEPIKTAIPTSLGAMVAIAVSGLVQHTWNGHVLWISGVCLSIGSLLGAQVGSRILPHIPASLVTRLFRLLLVVLAIYMIGRGFI